MYVANQSPSRLRAPVEILPFPSTLPVQSVLPRADQKGLLGTNQNPSVDYGQHPFSDGSLEDQEVWTGAD
jgi:hypothetical protein